MGKEVPPLLTLVFNGSPRPRGDTRALIDALCDHLSGDTRVIDCYHAHISPCIDCRACKTRFACALDDDMQEVYALIHGADNIVIASPVYYSQLTGPLLSVLSRLQPGFYARRRAEQGFADKVRRGGILLAGGGSGAPDPAIATARLLLRAMGCREIAEPVMALRTDENPAAQDAAALTAAWQLARRWNEKAPSLNQKCP